MYLKGLLSLGLTSYEAKCYVALLGKTELTAAEVAKLAGIPRSKVYETLEKLLHKGLCNYLPGPVMKYRACDPEVLNDSVDDKLGIIKEKIEQNKNEYNETLQLKEKMITDLEDIYKGGMENNDPLNYIEIIKDYDQINKRFIQLLKSTHKEILSVAKTRISSIKKYPKHFDKKKTMLVDQVSAAQVDKKKTMLADQVSVAQDISKRGVECRSIYELSSNLNENWLKLDQLDNLLSIGQKIRILPEVPFQMAIFDLKTIMFNLEDPISGMLSNTSQIITHRALAQGQKLLFDILWEKAEDYQEFKKRLNLKE